MLNCNYNSDSRKNIQCKYCHQYHSPWNKTIPWWKWNWWNDTACVCHPQSLRSSRCRQRTSWRWQSSDLLDLTVLVFVFILLFVCWSWWLVWFGYGWLFCCFYKGVWTKVSLDNALVLVGDVEKVFV